jgi:hypothetical protein
VVIPPVVVAAADAGGPYSGVVGTLVDFDAGASAALTADAVVDWDLDGDGEFDDASGVRPSVGFLEPGSFQVRVRIAPPGSTAVVSAAVVLDIAPLPSVDPTAPDEPPAPPIAGPDDVAVVAPQGVTTSVRLVDTDGTPGRFLVDLAPTAGKVIVSVPTVADPFAPFGTGADGTLLVTPVPGFLGTVNVPVTAVPGGGGGAALLTIEVTGNQSPVTGDDSLTLPVGVVSVIPPDALLANDRDPDQGAVAAFQTPDRLVAADGLSLVGVTSGTNGEAWLGSDGQVYVQPLAVGAGSFTYLAADHQRGTSPGTVRFTAVSSSPPTTAAPPTIGTIPPATVSPVTVPTVTVPAVPASVAPAAVPTPVTVPGAGLPATGRDIGHTGRVAALLLLVGCAVVMLTRVRRRDPSD